MMYSGMITFLAAVTALSATLAPNDTFSFALVALAFLMVGLAESGVRLGRKTYLVDATPQAERATFTAFSNSVIGVLALATVVLGFVAQQLGTHAAIIVIGLTGVTGAVMAHSMPEAEEMIKRQQG
jgi:MFS family permease